jgi:hypothetical protein
MKLISRTPLSVARAIDAVELRLRVRHLVLIPQS